MTKEFEHSAPIMGAARHAVAGSDSSSCAVTSEMHPHEPVAAPLPTNEMVEAFAPGALARLKRGTFEERWFRCVDALGFPYTMPREAQYIANCLLLASLEERAQLAARAPAELFNLLSMAYGDRDYVTQHVFLQQFPGIIEAIRAAGERYGSKALMNAM